MATEVSFSNLPVVLQPPSPPLFVASECDTRSFLPLHRFSSSSFVYDPSLLPHFFYETYDYQFSIPRISIYVVPISLLLAFLSFTPFLLPCFLLALSFLRPSPTPSHRYTGSAWLASSLFIFSGRGGRWGRRLVFDQTSRGCRRAETPLGRGIPPCFSVCSSSPSPSLQPSRR